MVKDKLWSIKNTHFIVVVFTANKLSKIYKPKKTSMLEKKIKNDLVILEVVNVKNELPDYNLCDLFEKKPVDLDVLRDEKEDIRWLRIKRFQLLPLLNQKVKFKGTITFFDPNTIFHTPRALLGNVTVNRNIEVTHLWIESNLLKNFCLYDKIQCKGEVYVYNKNEDFVALSIKDIVTMRRLIL